MCVVLDLNHGKSGSTAGERRMEYAGEQRERAKVAKSTSRKNIFIFFDIYITYDIIPGVIFIASLGLTFLIIVFCLTSYYQKNKRRK